MSSYGRVEVSLAAGGVAKEPVFLGASRRQHRVDQKHCIPLSFASPCQRGQSVLVALPLGPDDGENFFYVCMYVCMYVCVCMYVQYVCMYVCMYVCNVGHCMCIWCMYVCGTCMMYVCMLSYHVCTWLFCNVL